MRILIISNTSWDDNNSFGNSFSNIFSSFPEIEIANIYLESGAPNTTVATYFFQISIKDIARGLFSRSLPGRIVTMHSQQSITKLSEKENRLLNTARKYRWQIFYWVRDMLWKIGNWKNKNLTNFIDDFSPDIIFQPVYFSSYINEIAQWVKAYTGRPMLGYISDDCYTLKQFRLSPLYWIDRLWKRRKVKRTIELCEILYVISEVQKNEYQEIFKVPCKVLTKCADFSATAPTYPPPAAIIKMMYAGNLGDGRWQSLALLARAIAEENKEKMKVQLDIYTPTPFSRKMKAAFNTLGCTVYSPISAKEVLERQKESDVLVHVEGLSLMSRLAVRQSFSTKLVDFFTLGKCIFAIGPKNVASIKHLVDNDAAIVAHGESQVVEKLNMLLNNVKLLEGYGAKAYHCGALHHSRKSMHDMLVTDLNSNLKPNERP